MHHSVVIQSKNNILLYFTFKSLLNILLDIHLQNVTMCFRGVGNFEMIKPIVDVGWRIKKDYFQVRNAFLHKLYII